MTSTRAAILGAAVMGVLIAGVVIAPAATIKIVFCAVLLAFGALIGYGIYEWNCDP